MASKQKETDIYERDKQGIVGEKPEHRNKIGHHMGPRRRFGGCGSGYELLPDGGYVLAPCSQSSFTDIAVQEDALFRMLNSVQNTVQEQLQKLAKRRQEWFSDAAANVYRPDDMMRASYNPGTGVLSFRPDASRTVDNKRLQEEIDMDAAGAGVEKTDGE